ncbi:MAG: alpha-xylosidase [Opitutales bacterium]
MEPACAFPEDFLDINDPAYRDAKLWKAHAVTAAEAAADGSVHLTVPFFRCKDAYWVPDESEAEQRKETLVVRALGDGMLRVTLGMPVESTEAGAELLEMAGTLDPQPLTVESVDHGWLVRDPAGRTRMRLSTKIPETQPWSELIPEPEPLFQATVLPDGETEVPFMTWDTFAPGKVESVPLGRWEPEGDLPGETLFSLHCRPDEKFAGTGERFSRMNLAGSTVTLVNTDGLGVNNRRAYKNVPFYVSSRGYGLLMLTTCKVRLSLGDISTRAAQGRVADPSLDLVFIGGGKPEPILRRYRELTGFPRLPPLWSYGTWMSRMTYFSADETRKVARKMREGRFPCDVLHLDTGWFRTDWKCEWEFSPETFPDPEGFMKELRDDGFRVSLWQMPVVDEGTLHYEPGLKHGYLAKKARNFASGSNFVQFQNAVSIDFSNPEAVTWYQGLLRRLLKMGASAIKTDFGENIDMDAEYRGLPARKLRNLYSLLYQKAAFEVTEEETGDSIIWARAGWTGCQRYPVHWGGDCACSWDGMAGSLRGGLHIGLSGFAFWSHDVPGFHGVPSFMNNRPADDLYVRWTQFGVLSSHLRYHGTSAREPYLYPEIQDTVRAWLNLRYALIPYIRLQAERAVATGYPLLRALLIDFPDDPYCWEMDDQYLFGEDLLVAPVMNSEGVRSVYLPAGKWVDFWTGEQVSGPRQLADVRQPLERLPLFVRARACLPVYPEAVQSTAEMDPDKVTDLVFDQSYTGFKDCLLAKWIDL